MKRAPIGCWLASFAPDRIPLLTHQKQQADENARPAQLFRRHNLRRNNPLGIARPAPVNSSGVFRRRDKRRHRIHVRGKNNFRAIMSRPGSQHIGARAVDRHLLSCRSRAAQSSHKKISHRAFIRSDGFDVDQPAGECKQVHAGKA
jgi:hypothetical protein